MSPFPSKSLRLFLPAVLPLLLQLNAVAHPDKVEDRLLMHFATGSTPIQGDTWEDLTHRVKARVIGQPKLMNIGPAQALVFNGLSDWLLAAPDAATAKPVLPVKEMTASAWVRFNDMQPEGGLCGFIQDNGSFEKGWLLGYDQAHFTFRLASSGGNKDGDGVLTNLISKSTVKPGPWYHVTATYDGAAMRLYVNGRLEGESRDQSGDILYPDAGKLTIAAFADSNELEILDGALLEVKTYGRAMPEAEIAAVVERNAGLLAWPGSINDSLQFLVRPYLQAASATGMSIMAETSRPAAMTVEYAETAPLTLTAGVPAGTTSISTVSLTGLKPHTRYFYRVTSDDGNGNTARSEVKSFQTLPGPADAWAFGLLGDTQRNPDVTRRCADGIFALRPNFMLHVGDVVDDGFAKQQWVFDLFAPCSDLFSYVPVFPVIGNHEKNSHWYYDYFHLPEPEYFYTFKCGNAEFFMVDSNKDVSPESEQYQKLEQALAASTATWKFTAHHHPCWSSDNDDYGDTLKGKPGEPFTLGEPQLQPLVALYEKYGVDIAFAGHIHSYERTWPILNMAINQRKGVRYIVSGGGGGNLEKASPQRAWFSIHVQSGHHFCFATVQDRTIQFKAYDLEGRLFDTFELTKAADR
ncbi:MAG: metallophosphoesterase [Verrucomicrobiales bacterium]|nr:metallophosphoesterase [Verrucomicrobiales bacterium]